MKITIRLIILIGLIVYMQLMTSCSKNESSIQAPVFANVTVHDPSVIKVQDTYFVIGSHLQSAKSVDLMSWTQVSEGVREGNPLIPNVLEELKETFEWAQTDTLWAGDVIQLADGKFYMYYNACRGDSPRSALGVAVSDHVEGPYKNLGILLKSGLTDELTEEGTLYDATINPNTVDPHTFFDKDGKLWMVYGSYSGGIFILEMNSQTGFPYPGQGYGKKLLGGNHSRIEGPYVLYSPQTEYYYLFLSYGGLDANGGYNIRVARSKQADGPYVDSEGNDMIDAHGAVGTLFDDVSIEPFGAKLVGNFQFINVEGEPEGPGTGYVSPGHNSAYFDSDSGKLFILFHTRFPERGGTHELRVHQMFMNSDGWPVIAPHRYAGESIGKYNDKDIIGEYKYINHHKDISAFLNESITIQLAKDGTISGEVSGVWKKTGDNTVEMTVEGIQYKGVFLRQWDMGTGREVMTFTALSQGGVAIWGKSCRSRND